MFIINKYILITIVSYILLVFILIVGLSLIVLFVHMNKTYLKNKILSIDLVYIIFMIFILVLIFTDFISNFNLLIINSYILLQFILIVGVSLIILSLNLNRSKVQKLFAKLSLYVIFLLPILVVISVIVSLINCNIIIKMIINLCKDVEIIKVYLAEISISSSIGIGISNVSGNSNNNDDSETNKETNTDESNLDIVIIREELDGNDGSDGYETDDSLDILNRDT